MKNKIILLVLSILFNHLSFSQNFSEVEKNNILKSRGYSIWQTEKNGMIQISKNVPKVVTKSDITVENGLKTKDIGKTFYFNKQGYINASTLEELIPAVYDHVDDDFVNDLILVQKGKKYLLLNNKGDSLASKKISNFIHIDISGCGSFKNCYIEREGLRKVKSKDGKWGFVDNNWNIVIPCIYEKANGFENGHSAVVQSGIQGIIDKAGNFKPVANGISIGEFGNEGIAEFTFKNKKGVIDINGKILIPAKYDVILFTEFQRKISTKIGNKWVDLDKNGNIIIPEKKEVIKKEVVETKFNNNVKSTPTSYSNENQGCETTISEYEKFAKGFIKYCNTKKVGTVQSNMKEFVMWTKEVSKQNDLVMECATGENRLRVLKIMNKVLPAVQLLYGSSSSSSVSSSYSSNSSNSSSSVSNNSKQSKSHTYKVIISWNNPVATNSHQKPSAQNGNIEYFSERSGSFQVKPICPVCSKKQYNSISGFASGKDSKTVTINCN